MRHGRLGYREGEGGIACIYRVIGCYRTRSGQPKYPTVAGGDIVQQGLSGGG